MSNDPLAGLFKKPIHESETVTVWYSYGEFRAEVRKNGRIEKFQLTRAEFEQQCNDSSIPEISRKAGMELLRKTE